MTFIFRSGLLSGCLLSVAVFSIGANAAPTSGSAFKWSDITPTPDIKWHKCFDSFLCARLQVPLDWTVPNGSSYADIALTALPAEVPASSLEYSGPLLLNPGGPGGSGVNQILSNGKAMHSVVGKNHMLIGFDPRGLNNTDPGTYCFDSSLDAERWWLRVGNNAMTPQSIPEHYAEWHSLWAQCEQRGAGKYVGTPNVARDMLAITEKVWDSDGYEGKEKGLRYWGYSYGTALGMTFATLFPDRVDRMVLDGVVDVNDYYGGLWENNIVDADKVFNRFFEDCSKAGAACPFSASTPGGVKSRLEKLMKKVEESPIPVYNSTRPDWISATDISAMIFQSLYEPLAAFPLLGAGLAALEAGDGPELAQISDLIHPVQDTPSTYGPNEDDTFIPGDEAAAAILCSDSLRFRLHPPTMDEHRRYYQYLTQQSRWIAGPWARIRMSCSGWRQPALGIPAPQKFGAKTSNPILFASTDLDPVTPMRSARAMRKRYEGAGLLRVKGGIGHCTIAVKSSCVEKQLGKYFKDGKVEKQETVCGVDVEPFQETA